MDQNRRGRKRQEWADPIIFHICARFCLVIADTTSGLGGECQVAGRTVWIPVFKENVSPCQWDRESKLSQVGRSPFCGEMP